MSSEKGYFCPAFVMFCYFVRTSKTGQNNGIDTIQKKCVLGGLIHIYSMITGAKDKKRLQGAKIQENRVQKNLPPANIFSLQGAKVVFNFRFRLPLHFRL